jgi:hypothetical protein
LGLSPAFYLGPTEGPSVLSPMEVPEDNGRAGELNEGEEASERAPPPGQEPPEWVRPGVGALHDSPVGRPLPIPLQLQRLLPSGADVVNEAVRLRHQSHAVDVVSLFHGQMLGDCGR